MAETQPLDVQSIAERYDAVREQVEQACQRVGRRADAITIVGVTKTFPLEVVEAGYEVGLRHFGENRARELRDKAKAHPGRFNGGDLDWHMIGHLQTNKAKFVARHADFFECLDSPRLAEELNKRAAKNDRVMPCLVQVNISGADQKYGLPPEKTHDFLDTLATYDHLDVRGLMAMAAYTEDPEDTRPSFQQMRELFETYDARDNPTVAMKTLSLGMSSDFEVAIEEGSTMIRIGSALFGPRDYD
jgi:hypothetical protein